MSARTRLVITACALVFAVALTSFFLSQSSLPAREIRPEDPLVDVLSRAQSPSELASSPSEPTRLPASSVVQARDFESPASDGRLLEGRVVAHENGAPIAGAAIRVRAARATREPEGVRGLSGCLEENEPRAVSETRSDEQGRFRIVASSSRELCARVEANGRATALLGVPKAGTEEPVAQDAELVIALLPAASLTVRIVDPASRFGQGYDVRVSTAAVNLARTPRAVLAPNPAWQESTDKEGTCVFTALPSQVPLCIEIVRGVRVLQREAVPLVLPSGRRSEHVIRLGAARITGRFVRADGKPAGMRVGLFHAEANRYEDDEAFAPWSRPLDEVTIDHEGRFVFTDVAPGDWRIEADWAFRGGNSPYALVSLLPGQREAEAEALRR